MTSARAQWKPTSFASDLPVYSSEVLWETMDAVPIARHGDRTAVICSSGPAWLADDGTFTQVRLPDAVANCEEVHVAEGALIGTDTKSGLYCAMVDWDCESVREMKRADLPTWEGEPYCIVTGDHLTVVDSGERRTRLYTALIGDGELGEWSVRELPPMRDFEVVAATGTQIAARMDLGPQGDMVRVWTVGTSEADSLDFRSGYWTSVWSTKDDRLYVAVRSPGDDIVAVIDETGRMRSSRAPGNIGSLGGDSRTVLCAIFDGFQESVFRITERQEGIGFELVGKGPGKKRIGFGAPIWLSRSSVDGIRVESAEDTVVIAPAARDRVPHAKYLASRGDGGPRALRVASADRHAGTIIHLHGGPESYETDELRFFGLAPHSVSQGWDWRSLNYRGSRGVSPDHTTAAWKTWQRSSIEDISWAIGPMPSRQPVILAGWSFGAALALAAAARLPVDGLILGGTMGPLADHVRVASATDPSHESWFGDRFDLGGDDGDYFAYPVPADSRNLGVLSFHGRGDAHCPYDLFEPVRERWSRKVRWTHYDLPGGGHYAESMDDVDVIVAETRRFIAGFAGRNASARPDHDGD